MNKYVVVGLLLAVAGIVVYFLNKEDNKTLLTNLDTSQKQQVDTGGIQLSDISKLWGGGATALLGAVAQTSPTAANTLNKTV